MAIEGDVAVADLILRPKEVSAGLLVLEKKSQSPADRVGVLMLSMRVTGSLKRKQAKSGRGRIALQQHFFPMALQ